MSRIYKIANLKLIKSLVLLSFFFTTNAAFGEIVYLYNGDFSVEYLGKSFSAGQSTFAYEACAISHTSGQGFSHIVFEVPICSPSLVIASCNPEPSGGCTLSSDPKTGLYGVKWDTQITVPNCKQFSFTLSGNIEEGKNKVSIKAGNCDQNGILPCESALITGPSCNSCTPTPTPTFTGTPTPTITTTVTATPTPTIATTVTVTPTATPTGTPTVVPTVTPTPTPSIETTPTPTATPEYFVPICNAGGPYSDLACTEEVLSVTLDGSASYDPNGDDLSFKWTSDCPGVVFDDDTSPTPVVSFSSSNEDGTPVSCQIQLSVKNAEYIKDCSAVVSVNECSVDCLGELNGNAKFDECGVCDGDGTSCIPNCYDLDISFFTSNSKEITSKMKRSLRKQIRKNRKSCGKKKGAKHRKTASNLQEDLKSVEVFLDSIPISVQVCDDITNCSNIETSSSIQTYSSYSKEYLEVMKQLIKKRAKCSSGGSCKRDAKLCLKSLRDRINERRKTKSNARTLDIEFRSSLSQFPDPLIDCN